MELDHFNNFGSGMRMLDKITMVFNSGAENIKIAQFDIHTKNIYLKDTIKCFPRTCDISHDLIRFGYFTYIGYYEKEDLYLYL